MKTSKLMKSIAIAAAVGGASSAYGQDRMVEAIGITPTPGTTGFYDISAIWSCGLMDSSAPINTSGILELRVNGQLVERVVLNGGTFGGSGFCGSGVGCGGSCGSGYFDGIYQGALLCIYDGPISPGVPDCDCRFPPLTSNFPSVPLIPTDSIEVSFMPTTGSSADPFMGNNRKTVAFDGEGNYWGHTLESVRVLPDSNGTGHSIEVESFSWGHMNGQFNTGTELVLFVNGVQVATTPSATDWITAGACVGSGCQSNACATDMNGLPLAYCAPNGPETCAPDCGWNAYNPSGPEFVGIDLSPGDEIMVILRPAPGALPELPGFPDDDQGGTVFCPGDTNGDGVVNVNDLNKVLSKWNQSVTPGTEGDVTGNGTVNVDDLNQVLAHWGEVCFPV
ncbi:MAG: hypothetical protein H6812_06885 [Phycisphaeraceae bacterium]|nr:dockerin type I repeat-containing protein [Phycisphaerales bacterium]MCB9842966.1 hypothetical protein [Phycisphaeraceae bacterium]